jgi:CheY-like chemotaxis protein
LGLAVVHGIVQQSGGWIHVNSAPGLGTTFQIGFPVSPPAATTRLATASAGLGNGRRLGGSETILVVEDEPALRRLAALGLRKHGYHVLAADGPAQAVQLWKNYPGTIHLLVTDLVMPELNGHRLAQLLQSQMPELKVLYMSGYMDDAAVRKEVVEAGLPFLSKPFSPSMLAQKVRELLDGSCGGTLWDAVPSDGGASLPSHDSSHERASAGAGCG